MSVDPEAVPIEPIEPVEPLGRLQRIRATTGATRDHISRWVTENALISAVGLLLFAFVAVFFWHKVVVTIPSGHEGVIWRRLSGTDLGTIYPEGTQIIFPWNNMHVYDLRLQRRDITVVVLSTDGLQIPIDLSIRFHPEAKTLPRLHKEIGPEYADRIVIPEVTTAVREVMGQFRPQQLYTIRTTEMENQIIELAAKQVRERFVSIDDILISEIELPATVQAAIQSKLKQEQEAQEYAYRIDKETQEARRKEIEANGIARFQSIVGTSLDANYLKWRGIDATLELAKSPNAKVIVIGGREGLPLILDTSSFTAAPQSGGTPAPPPAAGRGRGQ